MGTSLSVEQVRIAERLRSLSANELQVLSEDLACVMLPERFSSRSVIVKGRNVEGQTTKGWPDAFSRAAGGKLHAVEATRAKSWEAHLHEDLAHVRDPDYPNIVSYFFVGGAPEAVPSDRKEHWVREFVAAGLPEEDITLLVGIDLVRALAAPECARIRQTHLGLAPAPQRFRLLHAGSLFDGADDPAQPTRQDFDGGLVHRPRIYERIYRQLKDRRCALVRGHGAAGKTTLAHILAAEEAKVAKPTYYLDLTIRDQDLEEIYNQVVQDFVEFGGPGVTFAIDNVHLSERLAGELVTAWTDTNAQTGSRLLLLGRERRTPQGTPLAGHKAIMMRAGPDELRGVLSRLLARDGRSLPPISEAQMRQWVATFGGDPDDRDTSVDLIAFSAAAQRRLIALSKGIMQLRPEDAIEGVRTRYWQPIKSQEEVANLKRLAALAILEVAPTDDTLPYPATVFPTSGRSGLVLSESSDSGGRTFHRLAHPALGQLLLRAVGITDLGVQERSIAASQRAALALRLEYEALDPCEAKSMRQCFLEAAHRSTWLETCTNLHDVTVVARAVRREKVVGATELDQILSRSSHLMLLLSECRSSVTWILFLSFLRQQNLSLTSERVRQHGQANAIDLVQILLGAEAHQAASFLRFHPAGDVITQAIAVDDWANMQLAYAPKVSAAEALSAIVHFESEERPDLARPPALAQVRAADISLWRNADITHLSHILRVASANEQEVERLLVSLNSIGWVALSCTAVSTGALSGALMSLVNHLPEATLPLLPMDALERRVVAELRSFATVGGEPGIRAICLLGTASELNPTLAVPTDVNWPSADVISKMISLRVRKDSRQVVGTHEIQLWLGLLKMGGLRLDSVQLPDQEGKRFLRLLKLTPAPSARSEPVRSRLITSLEHLDRAGWVLSSANNTATR